MIYITGDTHGDFSRFDIENFPEQKEMTRDDYVIICGDFGGVWCGDERDDENLDHLEELPFTILFVAGNHENYDALVSYPVEEWHGGKVQFIRPNVIHLMRGQVYTIEGKTFFAMGGAASHDISDGILEPDDPDFEVKYWMMRRTRAMFRINHYSWWKAEMPSDLEYEEARQNLDSCKWKVDYIITHCGPNSVIDILSRGFYDHDRLTDFLETVLQKTEYSYWYFGHYHDNRQIGQHILLYEQTIPLERGEDLE